MGSREASKLHYLQDFHKGVVGQGRQSEARFIVIASPSFTSEMGRGGEQCKVKRSHKNGVWGK